MWLCDYAHAHTKWSHTYCPSVWLREIFSTLCLSTKLSHSHGEIHFLLYNTISHTCHPCFGIIFMATEVVTKEKWVLLKRSVNTPKGLLPFSDKDCPLIYSSGVSVYLLTSTLTSRSFSVLCIWPDNNGTYTLKGKQKWNKETVIQILWQLSWMRCHDRQ